jgi:NADPH-dependent curcumin reductase CurA
MTIWETAMRNANRRLTLKARPEGLAGPEHFTEDSVAVRPPEPGEVLLETMYISIDPAMRVWISEFAPGDVVQARVGWQSHPTLLAADLEPIDVALGDPLDWIGLLGMTGMTAYFGMRDIGGVRPGQTVLVSGAAGAVGQVAGQVGRIEACRVVGIAGGGDKCAYLTGELGFDAAVDYKAESDLAAAIARTCPDGVDLFYDNVGGPTLEAAIDNLALNARVVICGRISQTASAELYGVRNLGNLIGKRGTIRGFVVFDYAHRYAEARRWLAAQRDAGRLRQRTHVIDDLSRAPEGLGMLFRGENTGKLVVKVDS